MKKIKRKWHPNFIQYMDFIIHHPNYKGLAIKIKNNHWQWIATAKSEIGKQRLKWCEEKARELGYQIHPGVYAKVMRAIHPTKMKVCQTCGKSMSIYYYYPSSHLLKAIKKTFHKIYQETDHINNIWDDLSKSYSQEDIIHFFLQYTKLNSTILEHTKNALIQAMEYHCREEGARYLSPGAMSNFPDRFDGFHTYNRCCRASQDKGRSRENLKSYTKDRRAFEYWSDGNIHAANCFMGSHYFKDISADHIGPISLGFVHDPHYIQPLKKRDNSSKRDRLTLEDIKKILEIEQKTKITPISWFSKVIWEKIKQEQNKLASNRVIKYRKMLKQNQSNFMFIIGEIIKTCGAKGKTFLIEKLLTPKEYYFNYSYSFDKNGNIVDQKKRRKTQRSATEFQRYIRIALESAKEFQNKKNRNLKNDLSIQEKQRLTVVCRLINVSSCQAEHALRTLILSIQNRLLASKG